MHDNSDDPLIGALKANVALEVARLLDAGRSVTERFNAGLTPLHIAAEAGSIECAKLLLERGAALEAQDEIGNTALLCALEAGQAQLAADLISAGALLYYVFTPRDTPEIREKFRRDWEWIMGLSKQTNPEASRVLDGFLVDVDRDAFNRELGEHYVAAAMRVKEVHAVLHCANLETLQLLAKQQPTISFNLDDGACDWPLKTFAGRGDAEVVTWLLENGADPNFTSTGDTALHAAVSGNHLECARLLLHSGANPNQQDVDGCVPKWRVSSDEMLDLLLAHGADPNIADQADFKPSHWVDDPKLKARLLALEKQQRNH